MKMKVYLYGSEILRRRASEVGDIDSEIHKLVEDMFETMYYHEGLGLAAPQVGVSLRVVVIDIPHEEKGKLILINPVICEMSGKETMEEGCLSFPGIVVPVERGNDLTVEFTTLAGKRNKKRVRGLVAQAVQHELDHLDGVLLADRMTIARRALLARKLRELRKRGKRGESR